MTNREEIKYTAEFEIKYDGVRFGFPEVNFAF